MFRVLPRITSELGGFALLGHRGGMLAALAQQQQQVRFRTQFKQQAVSARLPGQILDKFIPYERAQLPSLFSPRGWRFRWVNLKSSIVSTLRFGRALSHGEDGQSHLQLCSFGLVWVA